MLPFIKFMAWIVFVVAACSLVMYLIERVHAVFERLSDQD